MKRWTLAGVAFLLGLSLLLVDSTPSQAKSYRNKRGWLGVEVQSVDRELAEAFKLKSETGVVINDVDSDSPAEKAGLKESDVITKINNQRIVDADDLSETIADLNPGDKATITYIRDGQEKQAEATLDRQPGAVYYYGSHPHGYNYSYSMPSIPPMPAMPAIPPIPPTPRWDRGSAPFSFNFDFGDGDNTAGLHVIELTKGLQEFLGATSMNGAFVTDVEKHSDAANAGIKAGDVIIKVGTDKVYDPSDLFESLSDVDEGDTVTLAVTRDHKEMTVKMQIEEEHHGSHSYSSGNSGSRYAPRMKGLFFGDANNSGSEYDSKDLAESMAQLDELRAEMKHQKQSGDLDALRKDIDELRRQIQELEAKMK